MDFSTNTVREIEILTNLPSSVSIVELGSILVMNIVIPLREPPSEPMITVWGSSGSTVIEPPNGATIYNQNSLKSIKNSGESVQ
jgi:hypothetical protein